MARNKVDFPQPDGPVTRARSPASMKRSSVATSGAPFGSRTDNPSIVSPAFCRRGGGVALRGVCWRGGGGGAGDIDGAVESVQARNHGAPFGEVAVDVDEE